MQREVEDINVNRVPISVAAHWAYTGVVWSEHLVTRWKPSDTKGQVVIMRLAHWLTSRISFAMGNVLMCATRIRSPTPRGTSMLQSVVWCICANVLDGSRVLCICRPDSQHNSILDILVFANCKFFKAERFCTPRLYMSKHTWVSFRHVCACVFYFIGTRGLIIYDIWYCKCAQ